MSKPRPNVEMKTYASTWFILSSFIPRELLYPYEEGISWMNSAAARQRSAACFPCWKGVWHTKTSSSEPAQLHCLGRGAQAAFPRAFPDILLNKQQPKCYSLSSDEMVGRQEYYFFPALWRRAFVFSLEQHWEGVFKPTTQLYLKSFISIRFFFWSSHNLNLHIKCLP